MLVDTRCNGKRRQSTLAGLLAFAVSFLVHGKARLNMFTNTKSGIVVQIESSSWSGLVVRLGVGVDTGP